MDFNLIFGLSISTLLFHPYSIVAPCQQNVRSDMKFQIEEKLRIVK